MVPSLQTLFLPLENGDIQPQSPMLFLGAQNHPALGHFSKVDTWQPSCALAQGLRERSNIVDDIPVAKEYAMTFVQVPKQADEARFWLASATQNLKSGGILIAAAANGAGGDRIKKWMETLGYETSSHSKNKARVVWGAKPEEISSDIEGFLESGRRRESEFEEGLYLETQPGIFGWNKIDVGSKLLAQSLPDNLHGVGADFGSGYGYLSMATVQKNKNVGHIHLLENDARALECSKKNMLKVGASAKISYHWVDITNMPALEKALDFIVMNPPFHSDKETDPALGQKFIEQSSLSLKKGGRLFMVANAHLPYEKMLNEKFSKIDRFLQKDGFKIFVCVK